MEPLSAEWRRTVITRTQQKIVKFSGLLVNKLFENEMNLEIYRQLFIDLKFPECLTVFRCAALRRHIYMGSYFNIVICGKLY